jgi:hypothetical protein
MDRPFESTAYRPFQWAVEPICRAAFGDESVAPVRLGFAVLSAEQLHGRCLRLFDDEGRTGDARAALIALPRDPVFKRQGLVLCRVRSTALRRTPEGCHGDWHGFQRQLVGAELDWIKRWTRVLIDHAATRKIAGGPMLAISSIRLRLAGVLQRQAPLQRMVELGPLAGEAASFTVLGLHAMSDALAKTAGARAMLQHGLVEMQHVFRIVNHVYLAHAHA